MKPGNNFKPAATVIVPIIDRPETLRVALSQVRHQTLDNFELIIACQNATQEVLRVVDEFERLDERFRSVRVNIRGWRTGEARHQALVEAQSDNIFILQDDDVWLPYHLETLTPLLLENVMAINLVAAISLCGHLQSWLVNYADQSIRERYIAESFPRTLFEAHFGFRKSTYFELDVRWDKVNNVGLKHYLLLQFLDTDPPVNIAYKQVISSISLNSPPRQHMTNLQRAQEMRKVIVDYNDMGDGQLQKLASPIGFFAQYANRELIDGSRNLKDALASCGLSLDSIPCSDGLHKWDLDEHHQTELETFWRIIKGEPSDALTVSRFLIAMSDALTGGQIRLGLCRLIAEIHGSDLMRDACRIASSNNCLSAIECSVIALISAQVELDDGQQERAKNFRELAAKLSPLLAK